ncbi:MAG: dephospho-CoA kinase [Deltaproteobacteria bacterium GWA2_54_12]|nr:MAG: dephospho-CoA kinase [Deltaproteobacteria bacterium GWA2_54_12]
MIVGLTGGIATGKSVVAGELKKLGAHIIDADKIAREIVEPGKPAYNDIVNEFGHGMLQPDGTLDRKALGRAVFSDPAALEKLNNITHPRIRERIREEAARLSAESDGLIVLDVALLIEMGVRYEVEKIIVVYSDAAQQLERLMKRDNMTRDEALKRLSCQMDIKEKLKYADYLIDNSGQLDETIEQTRALFGELEGLKNIKKGT